MTSPVDDFLEGFKEQPSAFDKRLVKLMQQWGYEYTQYDTCGKLRVLPIRGHMSGYDLPWSFNSAFQAAEHLIPIICDDSYRIAVQDSSPATSCR